MHRGAARSIAVALLFAVAHGMSAQRYCLMDKAASADEAAHDCCAAGIGAGAPACCHADLALGPKAVVAGKSMSAVPSSAPATWWTPSSPHDVHYLDATCLGRPHRPPARILRI
jgi:hypothetical protein